MTIDSQDPRIGTILQLVSQLIDRSWVTDEEAAFNAGDDLEYVIAKLEALVEKTKASGDRSTPARDTTGHQYPLEMFQHVVDQAKDAIFWLARDGKFVYVNEQACRSLGYSCEELLRLTWWDIAPSYPREQWDAAWEPGRENRQGEGEYLETVHRRKDGSLLPVEVSSKYLRFGDQELQLAACRDITERQRAELELQKRNRLIDAILENSPIGFGLHRIHGNQVEFVSAKFSEIYGHSFDDLNSADAFFERVFPDPVYRRQIRKRISADIASGDPARMQWKNLSITTDTGERRVVTATNITLWEQDLVISTVQDVTEQAQAEEKLRLSSFTLERMADAVHWIDRDARIVAVNEAACRMLGYSREELVGMTMKDIDPAFDFSDLAAVWEMVKGGPPPLETVHRTKDGTLVPVEVIANYIEFEGKELNCAFVRDLTERKRAEETLRQSEARYRTLVESQVDLVSRYQPDTTLTFVNGAYCQFYGKTRAELIGQSYLSMVAPAFRELALEETKSLVNEPRLIAGEYVNFAADGKASWLHWIVQPILDEQGQVVELQAVGRDISHLKQTEAALRESQFFLQKSQEVASIGSYYFDVGTGQWIGSPMLNQILGVDDQYPKDVEEWISVVHPDHQEEMRRYLSEHVLANRNRFEKEYRIIRRSDQQERWAYGVGELEFDERGNPVKMIGTVQDITERKQIEETLRESENRFSVVFNEGADLQVILSVEPDGVIRVVAANKRYLEAVNSHFGISAADILDKTVPEVVHQLFGFDKAMVGYTQENYRRVIELGEAVRYEETLPTPLGTFYAESVVAPIFGSSNRCRYVLYSARDITERKQADEKIRQLNEELEQRVIERTRELEQANEEIKHFAYIVSHDLRAPLVNLKGFSAELRADLKVVEAGISDVLPLIDSTPRERLLHTLREDIPESLHFIESSVSNMDAFTKAILKLSRLGRLHLELAQVNVRSLVERTLEALSYQIAQRGTRVTLGDLPDITADLTSMEQIFGNILTNAVSYLDPGRPGEIDVSAEQLEDSTLFRIRDNGRGIAPDDADKVFAPFRRAGRQDTPGEGMGLAYVQTLVRRHGGRIWFESEPGSGTTFLFTISRNLTHVTKGV